MVGNGVHILCAGLCPHMLLNQRHEFVVLVYFLPIQGANMVLRVEWLRTMGPIIYDFFIPCMTFTHHESNITLTGDSTIQPQPATFNQFRNFLHEDFISSFHLISFSSTLPIKDQTLSNPSNSLPFIVQPLLDQCLSIFSEPHGLLPPHNHNHHIPLAPNSKLVNVKSYRYLHA